jgi:hypothetical protein
MVGIAEIPLQHTDPVSVERLELMGVANSGLEMDDYGKHGGERRGKHGCSIYISGVQSIREVVDES